MKRGERKRQTEREMDGRGRRRKEEHKREEKEKAGLLIAARGRPDALSLRARRRACALYGRESGAPLCASVVLV